MANYPDDRPDTPYLDDEYEQIQDQKKKRLEARKRKNLFTLITVCVLAVALLVTSFTVLFNMRGSLPVAPVSSVAASSSAAESLPASSVPADSSSLPPSSSASQPSDVDPTAWNLWLVGPNHPVDANFPVPELGTVAQDGVVYNFDSRIVQALIDMRTACGSATGGRLMIFSGFVGYEYQRKLFEYYVDQFKQVGFSDEAARVKAAEWADPPGTTENHTGLAVDFYVNESDKEDASFAQTAQYAWLTEHCAEYGFVLRYTAETAGITGVGSRPWHFRYVGVEDAKAMTAAGQCLEQYVGAA